MKTKTNDSEEIDIEPMQVMFEGLFNLKSETSNQSLPTYLSEPLHRESPLDLKWSELIILKL